MPHQREQPLWFFSHRARPRPMPFLLMAVARPYLKPAPMTMEEFAESVREFLPMEKRLTGLTVEERLTGLTVEERLTGLTVEERLTGLTVEERLTGLTPEERVRVILASLAQEDLTREQQRQISDWLSSRRPAARHP